MSQVAPMPSRVLDQLKQVFAGSCMPAAMRGALEVELNALPALTQGHLVVGSFSALLGGVRMACALGAFRPDNRDNLVALLCDAMAARLNELADAGFITRAAPEPSPAAQRIAALEAELAGQPLRAYLVGDCDLVAARSPEQALEVLLEQIGEDERANFSLDDVGEVIQMLDEPTVDEDGKPGPTLREELNKSAGPQWLGGCE